MTATATYPVWVANDIYSTGGVLKLRCRARCTVCGWKGPIRMGDVPDSMRPTESHPGQTAATDALRHAHRVHDWVPPDDQGV